MIDNSAKTTPVSATASATATATAAAPAFSLAAFTFHLTAKETIQLPEYKGSALRGGFGHVMKKVCCVLPPGQCDQRCQLGNQCAYAYIFETPQDGSANANIIATNLPHPFVILPPLTKRELIHAGEALTFQLTLIGKGIEFLPYFVYAFDELGRTGIGRGQGRYQLERVTDNFNQNEIYSRRTKTLKSDFTTRQFSDLIAETQTQNPQNLTLQFITPTRILDNDKTARTLSFDLLMRGLLRRASLLAKIHCGQEWQLDYRAIVDAARAQVRLTHSELRDHSWERYSNRQQRRMRFDSFIGTVQYEGTLQPFLPYILLGHYIHLGKNTTFGMGKYEIVGLRAEG